MNKFFFYLCVLLVCSVGRVYATAEGYDEFSSKPQTMPCMEWLGKLEAERHQLMHSMRWDIYGKVRDLSQEISATIVGKYGISDVPATAEERERILNSIDRTREIFVAQPNMMTKMYLSYGEPIEKGNELSEVRLKKIAQEKGSDWQTFRSHLAVVSMADGVSWLLKKDRTASINDLKTDRLVLDIQSIHTQKNKEDLNRLVSTLSSQAREGIVQTLAKFKRNTRGMYAPLLGTPIYHHVVTQERQAAIQRAFKQIVTEATLDDEEPLLFLKLTEGVRDVQTDLSLALIFAKKGEQLLSSFWQERFITKEKGSNANASALMALRWLIPSGVLEGREFLSTLEREYSALDTIFFEQIKEAINVLKALWFKKVQEKEELDQHHGIVIDPKEIPEPLKKQVFAFLWGIIDAQDSTVGQLGFVAYVLQTLEEGELERRAWEKLITHQHVGVDELHHASQTLEGLGIKDLEIEALRVLTRNKAARSDHLYYATKAFNRLKRSDLEIEAWTKLKKHPAVRPDEKKEADEAIKRLKVKG